MLIHRHLGARGLTDEQLAKLSADGVDQAFELLVARHRRALVLRCAGLLGYADAEEAVQEGLLRAYLALSRGEVVDRVGGWLWTIVRHTALNHRRARAIRPTSHDCDGELPGSVADPIEQRERLAAVLSAVAALPERQREALVMRELEGRTYAEIESRLGASTAAVRQLLSRARATVRERAAAITGIEPALRWILGSGGGETARLGALSGGCAVTIKLCAAALLPAVVSSAVAPGAHASPPRHGTSTRVMHAAVSTRASSRIVAAAIGSHHVGTTRPATSTTRVSVHAIPLKSGDRSRTRATLLPLSSAVKNSTPTGIWMSPQRPWLPASQPPSQGSPAPTQGGPSAPAPESGTWAPALGSGTSAPASGPS